MTCVRAEVTDRGTLATEDADGASACVALGRAAGRHATLNALAFTGQEPLPMPELARLRALEQRHAALELRIAEEDNRPRPDTESLQRLKREKLRLKDEMERLRGSTVH
jgi:hypothetical protein